MLQQRRFRRVRILVQPDGEGQWKAVALGMLGRPVAESPVGRLDQVQQYARNYERTRAWEIS